MFNEKCGLWCLYVIIRTKKLVWRHEKFEKVDEEEFLFMCARRSQRTCCSLLTNLQRAGKIHNLQQVCGVSGCLEVQPKSLTRFAILSWRRESYWLNWCVTIDIQTFQVPRNYHETPAFLFAFAYHAWSDFLSAFFLKLAYCFSNVYFGSWCLFSTFLNASIDTLFGFVQVCEPKNNCANASIFV